MKYVPFIALGIAFLTSTLSADEAAPSQDGSTAVFCGTVTAVNSNDNKPGVSFTAVDAEGQVKMFYISSLEHLDPNDRVSLRYVPSSLWPLNVTTIKFLPPAKE
jgi:hypothetical protein